MSYMAVPITTLLLDVIPWLDLKHLLMEFPFVVIVTIVVTSLLHALFHVAKEGLHSTIVVNRREPHLQQPHMLHMVQFSKSPLGVEADNSLVMLVDFKGTDEQIAPTT